VNAGRCPPAKRRDLDTHFGGPAPAPHCAPPIFGGGLHFVHGMAKQCHDFIGTDKGNEAKENRPHAIFLRCSSLSSKSRKMLSVMDSGPHWRTFTLNKTSYFAALRPSWPPSHHLNQRTSAENSKGGIEQYNCSTL